MRIVDWVVLVAFIAYVVWDGLRRAGGTKSLEGYYAARRSVPWWAAGLSVMATQASAITVIGTTGQGFMGGMEFVQVYFGLALSMVLLSVFIVPFYRAQPILTAYESLERRFGVHTRSLASLIFLVSRSLAFGAVIYAPAVVISSMTGIGLEITVIVIGVLTTLYTMFGGVAAVIWTDVKQMLLILVGLFVCVGIALAKLLEDVPFDGLLSALGAADKLNVVEFQPDSTEFLPRAADATEGAKSFWEDKYNFWSGMIGGLFLHLAYFGADHSQVQRILTNPTARESRMALLMSAVAKVPMQALVLFLGVLVWAFYVVSPTPMVFKPELQAQIEVARTERADPQLSRERADAAAKLVDLQERFDAAAQSRRERFIEFAAAEDAVARDLAASLYRQSVVEARDVRTEALRALDDGDTNYIFPYFILEQLPAILLGLVMAAIFAAAMSSADSALNSLSAATVVDFFKRFSPAMDDARALRVGRFVTLFWGAVATIVALSIPAGSSIIVWINKVGSFFYGSLLGVFALAVFAKSVGPRASFLGLLAGMASVLVTFFTVKIEFLWFNVIGAVAVVVVGWFLAWAGVDRELPPPNSSIVPPNTPAAGG